MFGFFNSDVQSSIKIVRQVSWSHYKWKTSIFKTVMDLIINKILPCEFLQPFFLKEKNIYYMVLKYLEEKK